MLTTITKYWDCGFLDGQINLGYNRKMFRVAFVNLYDDSAILLI